MLALQNGIDATDRIARAVSPHAVLAGVAYVLSVLQRPGVIKHVAHGRIVLGDPFGGACARHDRVAQALRAAGIGCETAPDIHVPLWEKFVLLAGTGGVMALTRLPFGPLRDCAEARELFRGAMQEADAVGRARGVALPPDLLDRHWEMVRWLPSAGQSSMLQDLIAGRRLEEVEALNGAVLRQGEQAGVATPLNFAVYAALKPYADGPPTLPE